MSSLFIVNIEYYKFLQPTLEHNVQKTCYNYNVKSCSKKVYFEYLYVKRPVKYWQTFLKNGYIFLKSMLQSIGVDIISKFHTIG